MSVRNPDKCAAQLVVLMIATSWLTGCATAAFEANGLAACLPVVEYRREFQVLAAADWR